ncbi:FMN-binding protein [Aerococcus tenax]|uniref:FMN-binding protein n=1 Tax=Aerococcus tenax TaxID=3078812 RepID=UPI0012481C87|nr:FMN-binding protein [Aerococcus tenax]MDL5207636.1 FMN-binding protein [Aerococcus tenax]
MAKYKAGVYSGDAQGFAGPLKVNVTVSEEAIEKIDVIIQKETPNVGGKALPILIERALENNSVDIDGVSGASGTTKAFKKAVGKALNRAQGIEEKEISYTPGTYAGEAKGFSAHIQVNVTVSKNKIEDIEVTQQYDTAEIGGRAMPIVIKRILAENSTEVDGVSGASLSSNGIKNAVNFALEVASGQREPLAKYKAGKYSSESDDMRVTMTFSKNAIEDLQYDLTSDKLVDQKPAIDKMRQQILDLQQFEFDSISGASQSSQQMRQNTMHILTDASDITYEDRLSESPIKDEMRVNFKNGSLTLEQINAILNAIGEELIFVGPDLRFQYFNEDAKTYTYSTSHLGELYTDCHPPQARGVSRKLAYELATRQRKSYSFWYVDGNGDKLFITYQALFDSQGKYIGLLGWTYNGQGILDTIDEPVRRGSFGDPNIPNKLLNETEEELEEYYATKVENDPGRDYTVRELKRLDRVAAMDGENLDSMSSPTVKKSGQDEEAKASPNEDTISSASLKADEVQAGKAEIEESRSKDKENDNKQTDANSSPSTLY